jgi:putative aldouronate transport system substrate-binding protein
MFKTMKALSLVVAFALLTAMAGCATGTANNTAVSSAPVSTTVGTTSTPTEAPVESVPALPIAKEPTTFSLWMSTSPDIAKILEGDMNNSEYYKELEKRTGVHINFINPSIGQEVDSLNLLLASNNYPDFIGLDSSGWTYPGGLDKGISDGVIVKLNDLVDKLAPNYKKLVYSAPDITKGSVTDEGNIAAFFATVPGDAQPSFMGPVVRKDWLDDLGLKTPETYDDWHTMLKAFKEQKGAVAPLMIFYNGFMPFNSFTAGYDVGSAFYQVDGKIKFGPLEPGYKDYLEMMSEWYAEGLVDKDFATKKDFLPSATYTTTGKAGAWCDIYIMLSVDKMQAADPNYRVVAVPSPAKTAGQQLHLRQTNVRVGTAHWVLTTQCKDPETAVRWIDYTYSPEGELLAGYGIGDQTYKLDADGKPQFTEIMYKNPDGLSLSQAMIKYVKWPSGAMPYHWERELAGQPQDNLDCYDIWLKNNDGAYFLPPTTLTSDEGAEYSQIMGDINTFISEMNVKFIMGDEPFTNYDAFVARIKEMNIDRAIALQQAALDRYNARK